MPRWNGGVIGAANNPTSSSAKGIWSLSEATKAIRAGLWPPSNAGADPYFENVTLLLPGDGTNGAQNNTFLDSSTNNFTITRNGNTTQGTFTPFSKADGRWSNYFDGTGDYLNIASNSAFAVGSAFTIEFWLYPSAYGANPVFIFLDESSGGLQFGLNSGNLGVAAAGVGWRLTGSSGPTLNTWNHCVLVRSGTGSNQTSIFLNGTRIANGTVTDAWTTTVAAYIQSSQGTSYLTTGYMSNVRIVKGTAVYDPSQSTLTVPTGPLTAISGTSLLTCQSNRFIDNSTNAFAITRNGDVSVQTFSPFPTLTAYAAGTNGGSGYFDGTGDYLTVASNANLTLGSSDFTIELWWYPLAFNSDGELFTMAAALGTLRCFAMYSSGSNGTLAAFAGTGGASWDIVNNLSMGTAIKNAWNHMAFTRSGSTFSAYLNGSRIATTTASGTLGSQSLGIGANNAGGAVAPQSYISGARMIKGTALYTGSTYTIPTAPPTAITNTSLLTNFTNGGIIDTSMSNDLETVGNAQISTTQSKFGGASMYFDGTGDYLDARLGPVQVLGGDFTVEMWVYPTTITGSNRTFLFLENGSNSAVFFMYGATGYVGLDISNVATYNLGSTAITTNSWQHLAFVRSGSTLTAYINGTSVGTATVTASIGGSGIMRIGAGASASTPYFGYLDEMRVTKGYARYTTNFTAPTSPFNGFGD